MDNLAPQGLIANQVCALLPAHRHQGYTIDIEASYDPYLN